MEDRPDPYWMQRVREENLILRWVPGLLDDRPDRYADLGRLVDGPRLEEEDLHAFLAFAGEQGVTIPDSAEDLDRLHRTLVARIALARFGYRGLYTFVAHTDPDVATATMFFPQADALLADTP